jgi:hypothetical protein
MKKKLDKQAKLMFYNSRRREGDLERISDQTYYSKSHISNMLNGRRTLTEEVANVIYRISRNRTKNARVSTTA